MHCQPVMNVFMHKTFLSRIEYLLGERKIAKWTSDLGIPGARNLIRAGGIPGSGPLGIMMKAENVSVDWLITGKGDPFLHNHMDSDGEIADLLEALFDEDGWTVYLLRDQTRQALVMTLNKEDQVDERTVKGVAVEVLSGPIGPMTLDVIEAHLAGNDLISGAIASDDMSDLCQGRIGTYRLLEKDGGLLHTFDRDAEPELRVADDAGFYDVGGVMTAMDQQLVGKVLSLPERKKKALLDLLSDM